MSLQTFIDNEFRPYYEADPLSDELGDSLIGASAKQAAKNISKYHIRKNQRANVTVTIDTDKVLLPANFVAASMSELYRIKFGTTPENACSVINGYGLNNIWLNIYSRTIYYFGGSQGHFRADGRILAYPNLRFNNFNYGYGCDSLESAVQQSLELSAGDDGRWYLLLDDTAIATRTENKFTYDAMHEISDTVDSITADLRDILLDETMKLALLAHSRQLSREGNETKNQAKLDSAKLYLEQSKLYGLKINQLASMGAGL